METSPWFCATCGAANGEEQETCFACEQPRAKQAEESESLLHERYRLLEPVGTGGFAIVYKAVDTLADDEVVAVKQINLNRLTPQEAIEATAAFNRELQVLSPLKHPHLPRIHEHFTDPDHWYLVMDFVEGETLERYLARRCTDRPARVGLPIDEVLTIGLQLCSVLDYLHTRQPAIIFRDLKPSNILRTARGHLYLIDFGIARYFKPGQSKDTMPFGSPGYAAPEQYGKAQTTGRADIYSLGALLHHLLSKDDPSETPFYFAPLRLYGGEELSALEALIMRMVQMDMRKRPESIREVRGELQRLSLAQSSTRRLWYPPVGQPPSSQSQPFPWQSLPYGGSGQQQVQQQIQRGKTISAASRRSFIRFIIGASATMAIAGLITSLHTTHPSPLSYAYSYADHPGRSRYFHGGQVITAAVSASGRYVGFASADGALVAEEVEADNGQLKPIFVYRGGGQLSAPRAISWSPDANKMAVGGQGQTGGEIEIWDVANRELIVTYQKHNLWVNALAWSPDGKYIASASQDVALNVWDAASGRTVLAYPNMQTNNDDAQIGNVVAWSPDNTRIAYSHDANNTMSVLNVSTSQRMSQQQSGNTDVVSMAAWSPDGKYIAQVRDAMIEVWNAGDGSAVSTFSVSGTAPALAWLPESGQLATAGTDGVVQIWDPLNGQVVHTHQGAPGSVRALAWLPDSKQLVLVNDNFRTVQVWNVS